MENSFNIPKEFYSYDTGKPFEHCLVCNTKLQNPPQKYMVEKCIRRYPDMDHTDVIYEYALCISCAMKQQEYLSQESIQNIMNYMQQLEGNEILFKSMEEGTLPATCVVHNTEITTMKEYVIQGSFLGDKKDNNVPYFVFGEQALEEMQELLSAKTRDGMNGFMDKHFSGPPEIREILRERKTVLI